MCIAVFRSVGTVAPRALSGLTGTPAGYPRLAQRKSGRLCLGDTLRDTLIRDTLSTRGSVGDALKRRRP